MGDGEERLRVAMIAGTLGQGGAEKQLVYMVRALCKAGVDARVYCLTQGDFYESALRAVGVEPAWVGQFTNPLLRLSTMTNALRSFRPHVVQSSHSYMNLYAALAGRLVGAISLGAMRSSLRYASESYGVWARWLITAPSALLLNSQAALNEAIESKLVDRGRLYFVPNAIDVSTYNEPESPPAEIQTDSTIIFLGRLIPVKRLDRFLRALVIARRQCPALKGIVVGDGPEREPMETLAAELGLQPDALTFLGRRSDVPELLHRASMLVLCSNDEGFPNVLLEAMAARLAVITTPAGDSEFIVQDGVTGYVVPFDDVEMMAERMLRLAKTPGLPREFGERGRQQVEQRYSFENLAASLISVYCDVAQQQNNRSLLRTLSVTTTAL